MTTQDATYKKYESYRKRIFDFDREENDFKPSHYPPKEDGLYVTLRCGLSGIYQTLDRFENGEWSSSTIAMHLSYDMFPDLKWEDDPIEVDLLIVKKK